MLLFSAPASQHCSGEPQPLESSDKNITQWIHKICAQYAHIDNAAINHFIS
jgi:hypothetical protein